MFAAAMGRAQAQQTGRVYRIAFAHPSVPVADQNQASKGSLGIPPILEELTRLGYVEGRNLLIERYSGEGHAAHYPDLARQIVSRNPDLIIGFGPYMVLAKRGARPPGRKRGSSARHRVLTEGRSACIRYYRRKRCAAVPRPVFLRPTVG